MHFVQKSDDEEVDGYFAFKRKPHVRYYKVGVCWREMCLALALTVCVCAFHAHTGTHREKHLAVVRGWQRRGGGGGGGGGGQRGGGGEGGKEKENETLPLLPSLSVWKGRGSGAKEGRQGRKVSLRSPW